MDIKYSFLCALFYMYYQLQMCFTETGYVGANIRREASGKLFVCSDTTDLYAPGGHILRGLPALSCLKWLVTYINTEHPVVLWFDNNTFKNFSLISRRINRQDPRHYVELYMHTLYYATNNVKLDFYFYQLLTNRYRPSFVEMHFRFCDMVGNDSFFGSSLKEAFKNRTCPFPPGEYDLKNMAISYVPQGFPFTKGRIYCNVTIERGGVSRAIARGYINMELKTARINANEKKTRKRDKHRY